MKNGFTKGVHLSSTLLMTNQELTDIVFLDLSATSVEEPSGVIRAALVKYIDSFFLFELVSDALNYMMDGNLYICNVTLFSNFCVSSSNKFLSSFLNCTMLYHFSSRLLYTTLRHTKRHHITPYAVTPYHITPSDLI